MRIQTHIDIAASAAACFDLSQNYALRPLWDSLTPHARPATAADGTRVAHCPAPLGMAFDVAYVSFQNLFKISARVGKKRFGMGCKAQNAAIAPAMARLCNAADRPNPLSCPPRRNLEQVLGPRVAAFRLLRGPWLFAALAGSWRFVPDGPGRCRVHFTYHLRLHPAVAWLLTPLVGRYVQRQSRQRLRALKRLAESLGPRNGCEHSESCASLESHKSRNAPFFTP